MEQLIPVLVRLCAWKVSSTTKAHDVAGQFAGMGNFNAHM